MARIGMMGGKVRGTPLVFISANPSGSVVAMGPQGYPIDDLSDYITNVPAYPSLPTLLPEFVQAPGVMWKTSIQ